MISVHEPNDQKSENSPKRPAGLFILFVLTLIYTGSQLLSSVSGVFNGRPDKSVFEAVKVENARLINEIKKYGQDINEEWIDIIRQMENVTLATLENFQLYSSILLLISGLGLYGAFKMFQGYKLGFHLYIAYSFLSLIQYYFVVSPSEIPMFTILANGLISLFFIFMYARHLHWMKAN
ncbi:MAG: hypothetical protein ISP69_03895 [Crocinitomicaceae bacterium]|nr:hypothetical protein [Crocinitomicaceae bacterium]|tara:strand:- start:102 stop:638 length:537 start_codon:yes stop_codon:yes gene_type:complete